MDKEPEEIYSQYEVVLKRAPAEYIKQIAKSGNLIVLDYGPQGLCFEWTLDQYRVVDNQEWSIVVQDANKSGTSEESNDGKDERSIRTMASELRGLEVAGFELRLVDNFKQNIFVYTFQSGSTDNFVQYLLRSNHIQTVGKRKTQFRFVDFSDRDKLQRSFAELNIEEIRRGKPRNAGYTDFAIEFLAKVPSFLRNKDDLGSPSPPNEPMAVMLSTEEVKKREEMMRSMSEVEHEHLPPRMNTTRARPLTADQLKAFQTPDGRYTRVEEIKQIIFRGGVNHLLRPDIWKFLLNYDKWTESNAEREHRRMLRTEDYFRMKRQWMSFSQYQEDNFSDYRDRKCQIEKDVKRTDRNLEYFEGEDNPNLVKLQNILMTYIMYNFDLGYVQGMSDLLAPILQLMESEEDAFWCFVGFMEKVFHNFDIDQAGMKRQLLDLNVLLSFSNPKLYNYFVEHQSENMYFCFRWLLVWFKREFSSDDILMLWEVLWTGLPCKNFHLFIAIAILDEEQFIFMDNGYEFNEILKHVNELSNCINLETVLKRAESIYIQVTSSPRLTNEIRQIVGLPVDENQPHGSESDEDASTQDVISNGTEANETSFENGISMHYY